MDKVDLVVGTFSKSFASIGGFVCGEASLIEHLRHHARSLIFSASIPPASAAAALTALKIFYKADDLRSQLQKNTLQFRNGVEHAGFNTLPGITPIIPIIIGDVIKMLHFNRDLLDAGVYVNPVVPPAVSQATVRTSLMATHTEEDIDEAIEILEQVATKNRILK
jgi:7-keto-8-aminopelargonate synthetase-like enzyme